MAYYENESKVKGILRTALAAEATTTTIDVDFFNEDDPSTAVDIQSNTLCYTIDPLNKTGKGSEIVIAASRASDTPQADRTRFTTNQRGILKYGYAATGASATAKSWDVGTEVAITTDVIMRNLNNVQAVVEAALPSGGYAFQVKVYADATARDAAITVPVNGMMVYLTDTAVMYQYIGGAWTTFATGTVANGSTTVAGKFEEATVAEQGTATATGATGARLIPANANLVKTSSGAADENKIAVLNSEGEFAQGFIASYISTSLTTGENVTAGNALRSKLDGLVYKAEKYPVVGRWEQPPIVGTNATGAGIAACNLDDNKIVYVYHTTTELACSVNIFSGEEITTQGADTSIKTGVGAGIVDCCKISTDKFAVVHWDDGAVGIDDGTIWICTVSGTTVTVGTGVVFEAGTQTATSVHRVCSPAADVVTVAWNDTATTDAGRSITATISGTTPTFGAEIETTASDTNGTLDVTDIDTNKVINVYADGNADLAGRVSTISGNTMTQGAEVVIHASINLAGGTIRVAKITTDKFAVIYTDTADYTTYLTICTVSGTVITAGTPLNLCGGDSDIRQSLNFKDIIYFADNKMALAFAPDDSMVAYDATSFAPVSLFFVTASGTTATLHRIGEAPAFLGDEIAYSAGKTTGPGLAYLNADQVQFGVTEATGFDLFTVNFADNNFIGFADSTITSGNAVIVNHLVDKNQSSLLTGAKYYLDASGALAVSGKVFAGTALSATSILKQ